MKCQHCGAEFTPNSNSQKYCVDCRDTMNRERQRKYNRTHTEQMREYQREYKRTHKEQNRERQRKYRRTHKEQIKLRRIRRELKKGGTS